MTILPNSATDLALRAFETRPSRAEALADLARHARDLGMNETAAMFARRGLAVPPSDDLLFVEGWSRESLATDLVICGYYSRDPETRELAHRTAEALALDRSVSADVRELARQNLFWYAPKLRTLAPSWQARQIEWMHGAPEGWHAMNPSICRYDGKLMAIIRCVNYWIEPDGSYKFPDSEPAVITRNFLVELHLRNPHIVRRTVGEVVADLGTMWWGNVRGMEDLRLFTIRSSDQLWFSCACRQMNADGVCEQLIGSLDADGFVRVLTPMRLNTGRYEKNWMPLIDADTPTFIYRVDPTTVVRPDMTTLPDGRPAAIAGDNFAGSAQLVRFDGGWLGMEHEPLASPINGRRLNQQRFVWFTDGLELTAVSRRFIFELNEEIEYVMGLVDDGDRLIISYGSHDRQARVGTLEADNVRRMLDKEPWVARKPSSTSIETVPKPWRIIDRIVPPSDHDALALDRTASPEAREVARRASVAELLEVQELLPSWCQRRLVFAPPEGFAAMAPSVVNRRGRLLATVRCINYACNDEAGYHRIADGAPMGREAVRPVSRTFMVEFDPETMNDSTLGELSTTRVLQKPREDARALGFEDVVPFEWGEKLWGIAAFSEQSADGLPEQWLIRIDEDVWSVDHALRLSSQAGPRRAEKNWMPVAGGSPTPRFVYLCDPTTILNYRGEVVHRSELEFAAEHLHGGSQAVPFAGGWLAVVHWMQVLDEANRWADFEYRNRFVWFDKSLALRRVSPAWTFPVDPSVSPFPRRFQIVHGLAWHPDGRRLVVGYEMYEREPWVAGVDADDVRRLMGFSEVDVNTNVKMETNSAAAIGDHWVLEQTNRSLQNSESVEEATHALRALGLPECGGCREKNWDTYLGIWHALKTCVHAPEAPILDAGGDRHSVFLPGMRKLGYQNLLNVNIAEWSPGDESGIRFRRGDITALDLPDQSQQFVMCQSVLEHDVDWRRFFDEMARVILPGGGLFVSIDYWGRSTYEGVKIFDEGEVREMVDHAANRGLRLSSPMDYSCREACVEWDGRRYTFMNMLFVRAQ